MDNLLSVFDHTDTSDQVKNREEQLRDAMTCLGNLDLRVSEVINKNHDRAGQFPIAEAYLTAAQDKYPEYSFSFGHEQTIKCHVDAEDDTIDLAIEMMLAFVLPDLQKIIPKGERVILSIVTHNIKHFRRYFRKLMTTGISACSSETKMSVIKCIKDTLQIPKPADIEWGCITFTKYLTLDSSKEVLILFNFLDIKEAILFTAPIQIKCDCSMKSPSVTENSFNIADRGISLALQNKCSHCNSPSVGLMKCARCQMHTYCGQVCQLRAWPHHKKQCKKYEQWMKNNRL